MKYQLEVYDPADPDGPHRIAPEGTVFAVWQPEGVGTIDPQWGKVGDRVRVIAEDLSIVTAFTVVERPPR